MNLAKRIKDASKLTGSFKLRSGAVSDTYFDKYRFESDPALLRDIAAAMTALIPDGTEVLAGLEMGGIPVVTMLSQLTGIACAFIRKEAKQYGTCRYTEGAGLKDRRIILVEDVVSSGGAIIDAARKMRVDGITVDKAVCVIDRETGGKGKLQEAGITLFSILTRTDLDKADN